MPESGDDQFDDDELQVHLAEIHALNRKIALVREEKEKQQLHQNSISIDKEVSLSDYTSFDQGHSKLSPCPPGFLKDNRVLKGHTDKVQAMCWSTDNRRLVSVAEDGKLIIWNAFSALKTHLVHLSSSWSLTCAYSPNGKLVAAGGFDEKVTFYDTPSLEHAGVEQCSQQGSLECHGGYVSSCQFLDDSRMLTASEDGSTVMWDVAKKAPLSIFKQTCDITCLSTFPGGSVFVTGDCEGRAMTWDIRSGKCVSMFHGHDADINSVDTYPGGYALGTASADSTCRLYDIRSDRELGLYDAGNGCAATSMAFSRQGRYLFTGYDDATCMMWDTALEAPIDAFSPHADKITSLRVSGDGSALCSTSWDHTLKITAWNVSI